MKLRTYVFVNDERGLPHRFGPGDDVPEWAAKKITNSKVWADTGRSEDTVVEPSTEDTVPEPPKAGPGSGREAWVKYARARGLTDDDLDGLSRDEIIDLF